MGETEVRGRPEVEGVVVGDDGSAGSRDAVRWAAREAALRGRPLYVLRGWSIRDVAPPPEPTGAVPPLPDFEAEVRTAMEDSWAGVGPDATGVDVHLQPVHAPAAQVLIEASRTAELVVVGTRGRGGFAELMLGSTADQVVRHSRCPVTVVRPQDA